MRKVINFNEYWLFRKPNEEPIAVPLPHTWNAKDGQDGGDDYWRGTAVYTKHFPMPSHEDGGKIFIEFLGAAMSAEVRLNGQFIARHEGGYSTFRTELTPFLQEENEIAVTVDNGKNDRVYPQKADFTFYGGLYRDVNLILVPAEHFELVKDGTPGIKVTPTVDLEAGKATVKVETWQNAGPVHLTVNGETKTVSSADGHAEAVFTIRPVRLWDGLTDPYLYQAKAQLDSGDEVSVRFGCRSFRMDPEEGFFLNGRSYPLRGVSRHQDRAGVGSALLPQHHREDLAIIREIGANTVRLAHYQQAQEFYDLCDEAGLIVWAEIPYITEHMPSGRENTLGQMRELIVQSHHHPSIVCWGLSNEITASGPVDEDMLENHRLLNDLCHRLDPTRPTTMAHVFMLETDSPIIGIPDISSYNLYFGWYLGSLEQNNSFFDEFHARYPGRVIGFSEYGSDANPGLHSSSPERGDYSEEYQCLYHEHLLSMIEARPYLWATHVWNLFDFAADGRDEGGKKGVNQKGLVTMDRRTRKDAFYLYKAAWSDEPFVHICGSRFAERTEEITEVRVYSNCGSVALSVDGKLLEEQQADKIFRFQVPLTGTHRITASCGGITDEITLSHREEPNPAYVLEKKEEIVNWFDRDSLDPSCYSIRDTFGTLSRDPATAGILNKLMAKMAAARGDVAKSASGNKNLQKMMAGIPLENLLKQAGSAVPAEMIASLNQALQQIKKPE